MGDYLGPKTTVVLGAGQRQTLALDLEDLAIRLQQAAADRGRRLKFVWDFLGNGSGKLFIGQDTATVIDKQNGTPVRTTNLDNTTAARRDLEFKERFTGVRLGFEWEVPTKGQPGGLNDRFTFALPVGSFGGRQEVSFIDPSNSRTTISGTGVGFNAGLAVAV